jgi:hypothetical protein
MVEVDVCLMAAAAVRGWLPGHGHWSTVRLMWRWD